MRKSYPDEAHIIEYASLSHIHHQSLATDRRLSPVLGAGDLLHTTF
jgi:hypothetical protein